MELSVDGMKGKFGEFLSEAERLMLETGYHRRNGEVTELREWAEKAGIGG